MEDVVIIAVVALILALAGLYVYRAKKSGQKCIGCPHSKTCGSKGGCGGNCSGCSGSGPEQ